MTSAATIAPGVIASAEFLGPNGSRVFSVRTGPVGGAKARLVVAPPFGAEAARNYRREVELGRRLAAVGVETVRFHYRGSGHSDPIDVIGFSAMQEDAQIVAERYADDLPTSWMGTRLGALVAAHTGTRHLVAWDPVIDATSYFRDVMRAAVFSAFKKDDPGTAPKADLLKHLESSGQVDLLGYPLTRRLYDEVREASSLSAIDFGGRSALIVDIRRRGTPRNETNRLAESWRASGGTVTVTAVALHEPWWYGARAGAAADEGPDAADELTSITVEYVGGTVR